MMLAPALLLFLAAGQASEVVATPAVQAPAGDRATVGERDGEIVLRLADGTTRPLTRGGGGWSDPVLSPDGRTVAFLHVDRHGEEGDPDQTSVWLADVATGTMRQLLASRHDDAPERNLASTIALAFSLDGTALYLETTAWGTSDAIHRVELASGAERFVIDGGLFGIVRNGRYAGHLLVGRHRYYRRGGSYDPVYLVRPDGRPVKMIPGSDKDEGDPSVDNWLRANRARR